MHEVIDEYNKNLIGLGKLEFNISLGFPAGSEKILDGRNKRKKELKLIRFYKSW